MSLSKQYKEYQARAKKQGKTPVSFEQYQAMADVRAQRGNKSAKRDTSATAIVARQNGRKRQPTQNTREAQIAELQRQLEALQTPEPAPASTGHVEIRDPNALATGRQLWKLNELGLLGNGQLTKGIASDMLDKALNA